MVGLPWGQFCGEKGGGGVEVLISLQDSKYFISRTINSLSHH